MVVHNRAWRQHVPQWSKFPSNFLVVKIGQFIRLAFNELSDCNIGIQELSNFGVIGNPSKSLARYRTDKIKPFGNPAPIQHQSLGNHRPGKGMTRDIHHMVIKFRPRMRWNDCFDRFHIFLKSDAKVRIVPTIIGRFIVVRRNFRSSPI